MNDTRIFTFTDVISVMAWNVVSSWSEGKTYELLSFLLRGNLNHSEVSDVIAFCRKHLMLQFPELTTAEMSRSIAGLEDVVSANLSTEGKKGIINLWISDLQFKFPDFFIVESLTEEEASDLISEIQFRDCTE
jgi:hypothetical protein